jgi:hypothetical protein
VQYALTEGIRQLASPDIHGATCCVCARPVRPKCGTRIAWHWAHHARPHCDSWWEPETDWHRAWKNRFPETWREHVQFDPITGEKHIADVLSESGVAIEFQNSPMPPEELASREAFYGKMLWIVNGLSFRNTFVIMDALPDPHSEFARDICFYPQRVGYMGRSFWRKSENPQIGPNYLVRIHSMREIEKEIASNHVGHYLFDWRRPRSVWYQASKPVYFDFQGADLWELQRYDDDGLLAVRRHDKSSFVTALGGI